ncbi:unnamed protein product, partial [Hapterophycus canaliculatus]
VPQDLDRIDRQCLVQVRDQHGNQRQTTPRAFAKANNFPQGEGNKSFRQSCTTWCQELKA